MAYRIDISARDRGGAVLAVIAIHAALLLVFLHLSGKLDVAGAQQALSVFDLANPPPPPPPERRQASKPRQKQGASAPRNIKSRATPVAAPKPKVQSPPVKVIVASATPGKGAAATEGAASVAGPGTGAGGAGSGAGSGSGGAGPGGGGDNGVAEPPRLASPVLSGYDFSRDMLGQWPRGATVFLRLRVDARGYVSECMVDRGTGVALIDSAICNLAYQRLRFRPALNRGGQAVAGWFGYAQPAPH